MIWILSLILIESALCAEISIGGGVTVLYKYTEIMPCTYGLPLESDVVQCRSCGMVYSDTSAGQNDYDNYYSQIDYTKKPARQTPAYHEVLLELIDTYTDYDSKILDMGAGNGKILDMLAENGHKKKCLTGVDLSLDNVMHLKNCGIKGYVGDCNSDIPEDAYMSFDCLILSNVIEHLLELHSAIENISLYLKSSGVFIVSAPDIDNISYGDLPPSAHFHREHINYFSIHTMDVLLYTEGFERVEYRQTVESFPQEAEFIGVYKKRVPYEGTANAINRYLKKAFDKISQEIYVIRDISETGRGVVLYGMGGRMLQLMSNPQIAPINVIACCDGNKGRYGEEINIQGTIYKVENISDIRISNNDVFLIAVTAPQYEREIRDCIRQAGFDNEIISL